MESKGPEDVEASNAFVPCIEVTLGHGEGVSEVECSIHVGVGEGLKVLGLLIGFDTEILIPFPNVPGALFE